VDHLNDNRVDLRRFQGPDGSGGEGSYYYYQHRSYSWPSEQTGFYNTEIDDAYFSAVVSFPDEKKYFVLEAYGVEGGFWLGKYLGEDGQPYNEGHLTNPEITSYTSVPGENGKLNFKYSGIVPASTNNTGYDLSIVVTGDVSVFELLNNGEEGPARESKIATPQKVGKTQMLPM